MIRRIVPAAIALLLAGCASQSLNIRSVPDEEPAAGAAAAAAAAAAFAEAAATSEAERKTEEGVASPPVTPSDAPPMYTYDPWERVNRFTYRFNSRFDEAVFLPAANTYRRLPSPVRSGVHNFFRNLSEIDSIVNYALQWRLKYGLRSAERLVINSTLGVGGLFDVATKLKLPGVPTGFATTLAKWRMHPGPYFVIPFLGPSTFRDGIGFGADYGIAYGINVLNLYRGPASWPLGSINAIDQRANVSFRYYATASPFEYETIRFLYVRKRLLEDAGLHARDGQKPAPSDQPAGK